LIDSSPRTEFYGCTPRNFGTLDEPLTLIPAAATPEPDAPLKVTDPLAEDGSVAGRIVAVPADVGAWTDLTRAILEQAATELRRGRLVAFPTETVYGLGGLASDARAIQAIFTAKQRPANNPLIIHSTSLAGFTESGMASLDGEVGELAQELAAAFWPGPLTLIVPRGRATLDAVTANGPHVAIRAPDHPVALDLLRRVGSPVAAPSANRSMRLSPTTASHVLQSLDAADLALVLDGGPCAIGIESTVLDITDPTHLRVLRPGIITPSEIANRINRPVEVPDASPGTGETQGSPGQLPDHYQPRIPLVLLGRDWARTAPPAAENWILLEPGVPLDTPDPDCMLSLRSRAVQLTLHPPDAPVRALIQLPNTPEDFARHLYSALHIAQESGVNGILVSPLPEGEAWLAVRDRLRRAATKNRSIIESVGGLLPWHC
jgi:L-threonylcarbamoyladenylate synthase